ncbi:hypothetical protein B9Z55_019737 [Caenorhabditis nigoni]|uniref:Uncharacterized protein n=1 Tax=Caenorhabditis nigoni TaxID=1611254 RepID=A0A2G5TK78_9PELO|nr:hypothetical protein B9Z55_019737 [Caenorhabditis nigoni]
MGALAPIVGARPPIWWAIRPKRGQFAQNSLSTDSFFMVPVNFVWLPVFHSFPYISKTQTCIADNIDFLHTILHSSRDVLDQFCRPCHNSSNCKTSVSGIQFQ